MNDMSFYEILNSHKMYYFVIRYLHNDVTDRREKKGGEVYYHLEVIFDDRSISH